MTRRGKKSVTCDKLDILPATFLDWPPFTVNTPDAILALILDANFHPLSTGGESRCNLSPARHESNSTIVPPVERNYVNVPGTRLLPQSKTRYPPHFPLFFQRTISPPPLFPPSCFTPSRASESRSSVTVFLFRPFQQNSSKRKKKKKNVSGISCQCFCEDVIKISSAKKLTVVKNFNSSPLVCVKGESAFFSLSLSLSQKIQQRYLV